MSGCLHRLHGTRTTSRGVQYGHDAEPIRNQNHLFFEEILPSRTRTSVSLPNYTYCVDIARINTVRVHDLHAEPGPPVQWLILYTHVAMNKKGSSRYFLHHCRNTSSVFLSKNAPPERERRVCGFEASLPATPRKVSGARKSCWPLLFLQQRKDTNSPVVITQT